MKFTDLLFNEVEGLWAKYLDHTFIKEIGEGTLNKDKFKRYLIQDYLYLRDYGKVFAMGIIKSKTMKEMKFYHQAISGIVNDESAVHIKYLKDFGYLQEDLEKESINIVTASYTNFMLGIALKGDCKEIAMATMPCTWSYYYIGKYIYDNYKENYENNFYKPWIEEYASDSFKECVETWLNYINTTFKDINEEEEKNLIDIFKKASLYELEFWNMANK